MINTYYNPHGDGDSGYAELTHPATSKFCTEAQYKTYCVVTRVSDGKEHDHHQWDEFIGQVFAEPSEICHASGKKAYTNGQRWTNMHWKDHEHHSTLKIYHVWTRLFSQSCTKLKEAHKMAAMAPRKLMAAELDSAASNSTRVFL